MDCDTLLTDFSMTRDRAIPEPTLASRLCVLLFLGSLLALPTLAQQAGNNGSQNVQGMSISNNVPGTTVIILDVLANRGGTHLDRQALLKVVNLADQSATWRTTEGTSRVVFSNIPFGSYDVEVSAVGYLTAHKEVHVLTSLSPSEIEIVLERDPSVINLDVANSVMSTKARREAKRAVTALRSSNLKEAEKRLDLAYTLDPSSPQVNFLLGYLYFQKKDFEQAGSHLTSATTLNPHDGQAWTLLGRSSMERQDYPAAESALEKAVTADADNWMPHYLLADTYLQQSKYEKARDEAQISITKSNIAPSPAQIVLGEALAELGHRQEGIQALNTFLDQSPQYPMASQIRSFISEMQSRDSAPSPSQNAAPGDPPVALSFLAALPSPGLPLKSWLPPGVDDIKPAIAPSVACPSAQVIDESGKRVQELVQDVEHFAAVEVLFHQSLDSYGVPLRTETRKYNYVASISEPSPGYLEVNEYRADKLTLLGSPDQIASTGFAALALVFHPHMRDNFDLTCEGLGDWGGQASWLVHFRQRDDRPNHMQEFTVGKQTRAVGLKGRAWISADKFQIVRIEAETIGPLPDIQLLSEYQTVEYGPVPFPKKGTTLWLPKSAEIYFDLRKHRYYRRHSFDHYMLYSVDTEEKHKVPKAKTDL
jgi:tetratricopeptide (TPR) repeat protein